jgi:DNA-binding CsgD family transcriptional regulator
MEPALPSDPLDLARLTPGEREVLERARSGSTAIEVARQLGLSEATVRTHLSHIYQKLGVRGRVELLARLQGSGASTSQAPLAAATMRVSPVALVAVFTGCAVAVIGMGVYQAWWTAAFLIGGVAVAMLSQRRMASTRLVAIGSAIAGSALFGGMSIFLLYGSAFGGTPWFVAAVASIVSAVLLALVARRLLLRGHPAAGPVD